MTTHVGGDVTCADFVGRDQNIIYGYTAEDVARLIDKVLEFLRAGAVFASPAGTGGVLQAGCFVRTDFLIAGRMARWT